MLLVANGNYQRQGLRCFRPSGQREKKKMKITNTNNTTVIDEIIEVQEVVEADFVAEETISTSLATTNENSLQILSNEITLAKENQKAKQLRASTLTREMNEYLEYDSIEVINNLISHNLLSSRIKVTTVKGEKDYIFRLLAKYDSIDILDPIDPNTTGTMTKGNFFDAQYISHARSGEYYQITFSYHIAAAILRGPSGHALNPTFMLKALAHNIVISEFKKDEIKSIINALVTERYLPELNTFKEDIKQAAFRNKHNSGTISEAEILSLYLLQRYAFLKGTARLIDLNADSYKTVSISKLMADFANQKIEVLSEATGRVRMVNPVTLYLESKHRKEYEDVAFDPSNKLDPSIYNLYRGFKMESKEGSHRILKFQDFVKTIICSADQQMYKIVWSFFAQIIQKPYEKKGTALIMVSKEGSGKNHLMKVMGKLVEDYFMTDDSNKSITSSFNKHLEHNILYYANEADFKNSSSSIRKLKDIITEVDGTSEIKGGDTYATKNYTHLVIDGNDTSPVEQNENSRRFINPIIDESKVEDSVYWDELNAEIDADGFYEAMMYEMINFDYSEWEHFLRVPPKKEINEEQLKECFNNIDNWWWHCLEEGNIPYAKYIVAYDGTLSITHEEMYTSIKKYSQVNGARMNGMTSQQFIREFKKRILKDIHIDKDHRPMINGKKQTRHYLYAPLGVQIEHFQTIKKINTLEYDGSEWSS